MKREQPWERPLTWLTNVVTILAAVGATALAAVTAIVNAASHVPQPWLTLLVVGVFLIAFVILRAAAEAWRRRRRDGPASAADKHDGAPSSTPAGQPGLAETQWTQSTFAHRDINLAASPPPGFYIQGKTFDRCVFRGPAILLPRGGEFRYPTLDPGGRDLFWELPKDSMLKTGAIVVDDCVFIDCHFIGVGLAGTLDFIRKIDPAWQPRKATAT
jgi:hypothetical protein